MNNLNTYLNKYFDKHHLTLASPDFVYEWLKSNTPNFRVMCGGDSDIADMLINRHDPLIDLGLALYSTLENDAVQEFFKNGDTTIKQAILSGPSISSIGLFLTESWIGEDSEILTKMIQAFDDNVDKLKFFFSNKFIDSKILTLLYNRNPPFDKLNDDQWFTALHCSSMNTSLLPPKGMLDKDIELDRDYYEAVAAAWSLFEILPVDKKSARLLSDFVSVLAPNGKYPIGKALTLNKISNRTELLKRWSVDNTAHDEYDLIAFNAVAFALNRLLNDKYKESRLSTPEAIRKAYEEFKEIFLGFAIDNDFFYTQGALREELRNCCWEYGRSFEYHYDDRYTSYFDSKIERLQQQHPEWFLESGDLYEISIDEIKDANLRLDKRLIKLNSELESISQNFQKLIDEQSTFFKIYMTIIIIGIIVILIRM